MAQGNPGIDFDGALLDQVRVNLPAVKRRAEKLATSRTVKKQWQAAWLLRAVSCIDLTTLSGDDTPSNVQRLCYKAAHPVRDDLLKALNMQASGLTTGAVCVYPARIEDCVRHLKATGAKHIPIASVATGFPAGQTHLKTRLEEIRLAVGAGANEIDIVINRALALSGDWKGVYDEVRAMKEACGNAHLKTILATGELGSLTNVYKASFVCMMAGADFIKTSTGKEGVNAILPVGLVMVRAIREYYQMTGHKVGFKPAGGIRSAKECLTWLFLMREASRDKVPFPHQAVNMPLSELTYAKLLYYAPFSRNLLKNPSGGNGSSTHWWPDVYHSGFTVETFDGGSCAPGALPLRLPGVNCCRATTYYWGSQVQIIDLEENGICAEVMDTLQPEIHVSEWTCRRWDCGNIYKLEIDLLSRKHTPTTNGSTTDEVDYESKIASFCKEISEEQDLSGAWQKVEHVFKNYGTGVRYLRFMHGGKDTQYWAGFYGAKMAGASVRLILRN